MSSAEQFPFQFCDIVEAEGYPARVFQVESYRSEQYYYPNERYSETVYELIDVQTDEWLEADVLDLRLLAPCDQADEYIRALPKRAPKGGNVNMFNFFGGFESQGPKEPPKPTAREISAMEAEKRKQERKAREAKIDALLDELNDYRKLADQFGDEEYKARVEYLTLKLAEASEK